MGLYACMWARACVCWWVGGVQPMGVCLEAEVVRAGSGKLIDGNRMFCGVARERERGFVLGTLSLSLSHTHVHTESM